MWCGRMVFWKRFFPFFEFQYCLNTDVHHSEMAHFNLRMMVSTSFLPSWWTKDEPCSASHELQK